MCPPGSDYGLRDSNSASAQQTSDQKMVVAQRLVRIGTAAWRGYACHVASVESTAGTSTRIAKPRKSLGSMAQSIAPRAEGVQ